MTWIFYQYWTAGDRLVQWLLRFALITNTRLTWTPVEPFLLLTRLTDHWLGRKCRNDTSYRRNKIFASPSRLHYESFFGHNIRELSCFFLTSTWHQYWSKKLQFRFWNDCWNRFCLLIAQKNRFLVSNACHLSSSSYPPQNSINHLIPE